MTYPITHAFKGPNGEFEIARLTGAVGGLAYVVGANVFVAFEVFHKGRAFDLVAYCTAFPAGLAAVLVAIGGAVAIKDRNVAKANAEKGDAP